METSRLLLVVVGDIDPKDVERRVAATFGKLPRGDYKESVYPALDFSKGTLDITTRALPTNYVQGVFNAPVFEQSRLLRDARCGDGFAKPDLSGSRTKRQLSYAPNAELGSFSSNVGNIYVTAVDANQAVKVMLDEVKNLRTQQINEETIDGISGHF
jgi:predicted Zn-dependent peptidase